MFCGAQSEALLLGLTLDQQGDLHKLQWRAATVQDPARVLYMLELAEQLESLSFNYKGLANIVTVMRSSFVLFVLIGP